MDTVMKLSDKEFDDANQLCNEIIDYAWDDNDKIPAMACLMAAVPFLLEAKCGAGEACRLLKILINVYKDDNGTTQS